jgi:hypothetical protein
MRIWHHNEYEIKWECLKLLGEVRLICDGSKPQKKPNGVFQHHQLFCVLLIDCFSHALVQDLGQILLARSKSDIFRFK